MQLRLNRFLYFVASILRKVKTRHKKLKKLFLLFILILKLTFAPHSFE